MSNTMTCRCGNPLPVQREPDNAIECLRCGRWVSVIRHDRFRKAFWIATGVAVLSSVFATALLGYVVGLPSQDRTVKRSKETAPTPSPTVTTPESRPTVTRPTVAAPPQVQPATVPTVAAVVPSAVQPLAPITIERPKVGVIQATVEPAGRYKVGEVLQQDVLFLRSTGYQFASMNIVQRSKYTLRSTLSIAKVHVDGSCDVEQTILDGQLIDAAEDMKAELAKALEQAVGRQFELSIDAQGRVTKFRGAKDAIHVKQGANALLGDSVRLWSLLDADAWKELAGYTFFQPETTIKPNAQWTLPATHDWGKLGTWTGKTRYLVARKPTPKVRGQRIEFGHEITFHPAKAIDDGDSPIHIIKADFKTKSAGGFLHFDTEQQRLATAEEVFQVKGTIAVLFSGSSAVLDLEETQAFQLTVSKFNEPNLQAQPKK